MNPLPKICAVCNEVIPTRSYQSSTVRTCSPGCAKELAHREHPELESCTTRHLNRLTGATH